MHNSASQLMLPIPFEVIPSAVNTLLPAFLQVLKAAGECLFLNSCELHRRSCLNSLDIPMLPSLSFFSVVETEKNRTERDQGSAGDVEAQ
jgi:hypothetical protein